MPKLFEELAKRLREDRAAMLICVERDFKNGAGLQQMIQHQMFPAMRSYFDAEEDVKRNNPLPVALEITI